MVGTYGSYEEYKAAEAEAHDAEMRASQDAAAQAEAEALAEAWAHENPIEADKPEDKDWRCATPDYCPKCRYRSECSQSSVAVREQSIILTEHEFWALIDIHRDMSVPMAVRVSYNIPVCDLPYAYYRKQGWQHQYLYRSAPLKKLEDWRSV